jgi:hypothetical protein
MSQGMGMKRRRIDAEATGKTGNEKTGIKPCLLVLIPVAAAQVALQQSLILRLGNNPCSKKPEKGGPNFDYHKG